MEKICDIILNPKNLNQNVVINGWVKKIRKLGSLIFADIYDRSGIVQIIVEKDNKYYEEILRLSKQSCVCVTGTLQTRATINNSLETGHVEIKLISITIYSNSLTTPLLIETQTDALEETRLKYRYLDLRRKNIQDNIIFRSTFFHAIRNFLHKHDFIEIETPILSKQTPEGANDYLVPTRLHKAFALPQSPQLYKQLLMVSGFLKYFQIAKCFRDEDLRSDRQPEFTQLDIELSFCNEESVMDFVEKMMISVFNQTLNVNLCEKFKRISYADCLEFFGSDKPDLRYDYQLFDLKPFIKQTQANIFNNALKNNLAIKAIIFNDYLLSKNDLKMLEKYAKDNKAQGLISIVFENNNIIEGTFKNIFAIDDLKLIIKKFKINKGTLLIVVDRNDICCKALGAIRQSFIKQFKPIPKKAYEFIWVIDWPLFEYDETQQKYSAAHHPFTSPSIESLASFDIDKDQAKARAYDLVLNGYEIGGGSIRIYDRAVQERMFKAIGLTKKEYEKKFGFLLNAFNYGVPPHGGIALGLDRILMIILKSDTIRDVIAFPKNSSGIDLMLDAPDDYQKQLLDELGLLYKKQK